MLKKLQPGQVAADTHRSKAMTSWTQHLVPQSAVARLEQQSLEAMQLEEQRQRQAACATVLILSHFFMGPSVVQDLAVKSVQRGPGIYPNKSYIQSGFIKSYDEVYTW